MVSDFELFVRIVASGGLSAAGRELDLSPAMISKRLSRLEARLGARLVQRTTRNFALTELGREFHERALAIVAAVEEAEDFVAGRSGAARGTLKVSAPTSFGRMHLAPHLKRFLDAYPEIALDIDLTDDFVDLVAAGVDVAIRIAALSDSSLIAQRLAANHRVLCATPAYLLAHGEPEGLDDLRDHRLLAANNQLYWRLEGPGGLTTLRVHSVLRTNSSEVARECLLASVGIALRSTWDIGEELRRGALKVLLPAWRGASDVAIHALYPSRRFVSRNVQLFVRFLADLYGPTPYWDRGLAASLPSSDS